MITVVTVPPSVIDTWPAPDPAHPRTEGPALETVGVVLAVVVSLLVTARIYSRFFLTRAPGIDDAMVVVATVRIFSFRLYTDRSSSAKPPQAIVVALTGLVISDYKKHYIGVHLYDAELSNLLDYRYVRLAPARSLVPASLTKPDSTSGSKNIST